MTPHHILIVEDDPNTAEMLIAYFGSQDYQVTAVEMGKQALEFVQETLPDLVVLDIRLPDIDGYELCRRLRANRRTAHVPIIFLTERRERIDRLVGLELGAVDYVTKPFDIQELRLRVRNILRRVSMDPVAHPVTGLPYSALAQETLSQLAGQTDRNVVVIGLEGLDDFSEEYGFVARDDVLRAVALMVQRISEEEGGSETFVGHLEDAQFFVIAEPKLALPIKKRLEKRLEEAVAFFYPSTDLDSEEDPKEEPLSRLSVKLGIVTDPGSLEDFEGLRTALQSSLSP
jgi:DNA-binding response OmpR family regulator